MHHHIESSEIKYFVGAHCRVCINNLTHYLAGIRSHSLPIHKNEQTYMSPWRSFQKSLFDRQCIHWEWRKGGARGRNGWHSPVFSAAFPKKIPSHSCWIPQIESNTIKGKCHILFLCKVYGYHIFIVLNAYIEIAKSDRRILKVQQLVAPFTRKKIFRVNSGHLPL